MSKQLIYEHTDIPVGMTAAEYRRMRAAQKRASERRARPRAKLRRLVERVR